MASPLPCLRAVSAADRGEAALDIPCMCVGLQTTSKSAAATSYEVARVTGTTWSGVAGALGGIITHNRPGRAAAGPSTEWTGR